jgi:hypothetical protein
MYQHKCFAQNIPDLDAGEQHLSFAITADHLDPHDSTAFLSQSIKSLLFMHILFRHDDDDEDSVWAVDTLDNLLQGFFSLLDPVCPCIYNVFHLKVLEQ